MLETGEKGPPKNKLEALQRKAAEAPSGVAALFGAEAEPALARGRSNAPRRSHGRIALPSDDDPITRMNKAVQECESALDRLVRFDFTEMQWAHRDHLCVTVAAALSAAVSFPFLDLPTAISDHLRRGAPYSVWLCGCSSLARPALDAEPRQDTGRNLAEAVAGRAGCSTITPPWEYAEERASQAERHTRKKKELTNTFLPLFEAQRKQYRCRTGPLRNGVRGADR